MQIRRVLLLFALVLGLSAAVASIAPPPDTEREPAGPTVEPNPTPPFLRPALDLRVHPPGGRRVARRVQAGSSFSLTVSVPKAGDVVLEGLGLQQTADPFSPADFELLASPPGIHTVAFVPIGGRRRVAGRLVFVDAARLKPRRHGR